MDKGLILVRVLWDAEAQVWVARSEDIDGLNIEAASLEALEPKVIAAIADLLEVNGYSGGLSELPVHFLAERTSRVATPRAA